MLRLPSVDSAAKPDTPVHRVSDKQEQTGLAATELHGPQTADPWLQRVIDNRYRILRRLAEGGMGMVFVAEHLALRKEFALKVIRPELAHVEEVAARFAREAMAAAQFDHPHVVSAIDYGSLPEGGSFLVMPLVRGQSLRQLLREQGALPWQRAANIGAQIADALSAAHARGIVHRDLKPENVLVETRDDGSDLVRLLDFGIARMDAQHGEAPAQALPGHALTRVGVVMGTPGYMAPEQAVGGTLDHRADLYALGVVLWETLTGRELWAGEDFTMIVAQQMAGNAPPLRSSSPDPTRPEPLEACIHALLQRDVEARPERAGLARDTLQAIALGSPSGQPPQIWDMANRLAARASQRVHSSHLGQQFASWPRVRRQVALGGLMGGLCVAILLALLLGDSEIQAPAVTITATAANDEPQAPQEPPIPPELTATVDTLLQDRRLHPRRQAANQLLEAAEHQPLPDYIQAIATFEAARNCTDRDMALDRFAELNDPRTRRTLLRYHHSRDGCGFLGLADCYSCIRTELQRILDNLPGGGEETEPDPPGDPEAANPASSSTR